MNAPDLSTTEVLGSDEATLIGATGSPCRSWVSPWGDVTPWRRTDETVRWFIAAEDRWHVPASEAAVRQRRIEGTPVDNVHMYRLDNNKHTIGRHWARWHP